MERHNGLEPDPEGAFVYHDDAQATIAALQARVKELEEWVQDQSTANLETMRHMDEMQSRAMDAESQLTQRTAELEAAKRLATNAQWQIDYVLDEAKKAFDLKGHYTPSDLVDCVLRPAASMLKERDELKAELERVKQELCDADERANEYQKALHDFETERALPLSIELERVRLLSSHNERRLEEVDKKYKELHGILLALPKVEGEIVAQAGYVKDRKKVYACFGSDADMTAYAAIVQHRQGMEG